MKIYKSAGLLNNKKSDETANNTNSLIEEQLTKQFKTGQMCLVHCSIKSPSKSDSCMSLHDFNQEDKDNECNDLLRGIICEDLDQSVLF